MPHQESTCEARRIELFLRQQLGDQEQAAFETHLDECDACRRKLEALAAKAETWAAVRESLGSDEIRPDWSDEDLGSAEGSFGSDESAVRLESVVGFLSPTDDPRMLGRLGGYEIVGIVGQGGMGVVLKGLDPALNRYVAIKVLSPHLAASGSARRRFAREARAAAAVTHENVVAIHGVSEWNGLPYLVMPYVRGESLQKRLNQHGPLGLNEILRVGRQVAAGLAAAHAQGLVHRDIKPANILLEDGVERLQITDFGLARAVDDASLTRTGVIAGTPQFMSPEQARGEAIDARSDLFSFGSTLYALCTGRPPFRAETSYGILRRITDNEPRPIRDINPEIPEWLAAIIGKLQAKPLRDRFSSAHEVSVILEQCLAHVQQPTTIPLPPTVARLVRSSTPTPSSRSTWLKRRPAVRWIMGAGVLVASVIAVGLLLNSALSKRPAEKPDGAAIVVTRPQPTVPPQAVKRSGWPSHSEWDESAQQLDDLKRDNEDLSARAKRLWDDEPMPE